LVIGEPYKKKPQKNIGALSVKLKETVHRDPNEFPAKNF
jgi:hypothetical protein